MSTIRILHAIGIMNRGGAETLIMNLYRNIDRTRVQFDFLTHRSEPGAFDEEILTNGGQIYSIPYAIKSGHFAYVRALDDFFRNHPEYKIVHSHMNETSGLILRSAKKMGVSIRIAHSHTSDPVYPLIKSIYFNYAKRLLPKNATHFFACSEKASRYLFGKKITESSQMTLIKNGVLPSQFRFKPETREKTRSQMGLDKDTLVIGHVGSFQTVKNQTFLIDILSEIQKIREKTVLVLIGDGMLQNQIKQKAVELGLEDNVKFLGVRSDVENMLQIMDVFVFPSLFEGLPVTLIEAQAAGLRCLVSNTITKEVDIRTGQIEFLPLGDASYWAHKVLQTSTERLDSTEHLIRCGYDVTEVSKKLQDYYMKLWR